jgi:hypothetical protein
MKPHAIALALMIGLAPSLAYAQGGGGGGGGGVGAGGGSAGSGSAAGSPSAGSAGAGSLGTSGVPPGPANAAGQNNAGNDPSGSGHTPTFNSGTTTGLANPTPATPSDGNMRNSTGPTRGTNSIGTAQGTGIGGGGSLRSNGTRMPGGSGATTTKEQSSDAMIDAENKKLDRALNTICRGC